MKLHLTALAAVLLCCPALALAQAAPPATTPMKDGTYHASVPSYGYCSNDGGATWIPCPTPSGSSNGTASGTVVTGNQSYTPGQSQPLNLTPTGRLKVGLSSAGNIDPAAQLATTLEADIIACKYRATPATWSDQWTGAIRCNPTGALVVDSIIQSVPTDRGALIGTTAITVAPANAARRGWSIQVQGSSGACYVNTITTATADYHSLQVAAGGYIQSPDSNVSTAPLSVICTAASTPVFFREW